MKRKICARCSRPEKVCYCHTIKPVINSWPIFILQHPIESRHAIGTARIAQLSLSQCRLQPCERYEPFSIESHAKTSADTRTQQPILVYPGEDATPVESIAGEQPRTLMFLDASWRKSRRMLFESSYLMSLRKIYIEPDTSSHYRIRKAPNKKALSTLEAIVYVLSALEGDTQRYQPLLDSMAWMIEKQIELMGSDVFERNYKNKEL